MTHKLQAISFGFIEAEFVIFPTVTDKQQLAGLIRLCKMQKLFMTFCFLPRYDFLPSPIILFRQRRSVSGFQRRFISSIFSCGVILKNINIDRLVLKFFTPSRPELSIIVSAR